MKRARKKTSILFPEPEGLPRATRNGMYVWKEDYVRHAFFLSLMGATDTQMAQCWGVSTRIVEKWKREKPEFLASIKKGKMTADAKVSHSLYLAAIGYSHPDEVIMANKIREFDPETGKLVREYTEPLRVKTTKNYPPNVTAAIKWLQARQPEVWGHKVQIGGTINHNHKLDLSKYTMEELELLNRLGLQQRNPDIEDADYEEE